MPARVSGQPRRALRCARFIPGLEWARMSRVGVDERVTRAALRDCCPLRRRVGVRRLHGRDGVDLSPRPAGIEVPPGIGELLLEISDDTLNLGRAEKGCGSL